jgi:hypothetical protein
MKKKLSIEQQNLLNKFKKNNNNSANFDVTNKKANSNAPTPQIRRSGSRGK